MRGLMISIFDTAVSLGDLLPCVSAKLPQSLKIWYLTLSQKWHNNKVTNGDS